MTEEVMRIIVPCLAATLLGGASLAQVSKVGTGYQFRRSLKSGEVAKFWVAQKTVNDGVLFPESRTPITLKLNSVRGGMAFGVYELGIQKRNIRTKPFEMNAFSATNATNPLWHLGDLRFPQNAVAPGKGWSQSVSHPAFGTSSSLNVQFVGIKTLGKRKVAELKLSLNNKTEGGVVTGTGTALIRLQDGSWESLNWSESVARYDRDNSFKTNRTTGEWRVARS
jgi:hypothetical protein